MQNLTDLGTKNGQRSDLLGLNFPGGACPQTPLILHACAMWTLPHYLEILNFRLGIALYCFTWSCTARTKDTRSYFTAQNGFILKQRCMQICDSDPFISELSIHSQDACPCSKCLSKLKTVYMQSLKWSLYIKVKCKHHSRFSNVLARSVVLLVAPHSVKRKGICTGVSFIYLT